MKDFAALIKGQVAPPLELPGKDNAITLHRQAREAGISIAPGPLFSPTGDSQNFIRLNCGYPWSARTERAIGTLGHLVRKLPG